MSQYVIEAILFHFVYYSINRQVERFLFKILRVAYLPTVVSLRVQFLSQCHQRRTKPMKAKKRQPQWVSDISWLS